VLAEEEPDVLLGAGDVQVAVHDPAGRRPPAFIDEGADAGGLRVVDHHHVEVLSKEVGVHGVVALPEISHLSSPGDVTAAQGHVHGPVDRGELLAGAHHLPLAVQAQVCHQGDGGVQQLGDAGAESGDAEVEDAKAAQWPGQTVKLGELFLAD
jgi:hypothetical protein